jgi:hypothetical protein
LDSYAVRSEDLPAIAAHLPIVSRSVAGHPFMDRIAHGEGDPILTGTVPHRTADRSPSPLLPSTQRDPNGSDHAADRRHIFSNDTEHA